MRRCKITGSRQAVEDVLSRIQADTTFHGVHSEGLDLLQSLEVEILQVTVAHFFARNSPLETSPRESDRGVAGELKIQAILAPDTFARHSSAGLSTGRQRAIRHRLQDENHGKRRALEVAEKDVDERDVDAGALHCGDSGGKTKCDDGFVHVCVCDRVVQVGVMFASGVIDNMVVGGQSSVPAPRTEGRFETMRCHAEPKETKMD